jgi:hypothetical protein
MNKWRLCGVGFAPIRLEYRTPRAPGQLLGSARALPSVRFAKGSLSWAGPFHSWSVRLFDCFFDFSRQTRERLVRVKCEREPADSLPGLTTSSIHVVGFHKWEVSTTFSLPIKLKYYMDCVFSLHESRASVWIVSFFYSINFLFNLNPHFFFSFLCLFHPFFISFHVPFFLFP